MLLQMVFVDEFVALTGNYRYQSVTSLVVIVVFEVTNHVVWELHPIYIYCHHLLLQLNKLVGHASVSSVLCQRQNPLSFLRQLFIALCACGPLLHHQGKRLSTFHTSELKVLSKWRPEG